MKGDFAVGLTIIGFSLFYLYFANQVPQAGSTATVGPRAFPFGIGIMMLLSGVWLALSARRAQAQGVVGEPLEVVDWRTLAMCAGMLAAYAVLQPLLGFLICTPPLFFGQAWAFGSRNWKRDAIVAVLLSVAVWLAFNYGLRIRIA